MDDIFTSAPQVASFNEGQEIITYEPPKAISWAKLVKDRHVRIVSFQGKTGWSDGYMLEVGEVPERLSKIKDFIESRRDDPIDADKLLPELYPDAVVVDPLAIILGNGFRKEGVFMGNRPDIVYLSNTIDDHLRLKHWRDPAVREVWIDKRYVDYFVKRYPAPWLKFLSIGPTQPVVVEHKQEIVGMIMPIAVEESLRMRCREFFQSDELPAAPPPTERSSMSALEQQYSVKRLQEMARDAGLSPTGDKRRLIKELQRAGVL